MDEDLSFTDRIETLTKTASVFDKYSSSEMCQSKLIHGFICWRFEYCYAVFIILPKKTAIVRSECCSYNFNNN